MHTLLANAHQPVYPKPADESRHLTGRFHPHNIAGTPMAYRDHDDSTDEGPDSVDLAGDDDQDLLTPCPKCKVMMYDDAERCPNCGEWVSPAGTQRLPPWVVVTIFICLIVFIVLAMR